MKIIDNRIGDLVHYKHLKMGEVFEICRCGEAQICMKTTLVIDWHGEDCELHGLKKNEFGRYEQEFAVNLKTGLHFDVEPDKIVRKIKATIVVED